MFAVSTFTKGDQMVPVLNQLGVHCSVYGNHDFGKYHGLRLYNLKLSCRFRSGDPELTGVEDHLPLVDVQRDGQGDGTAAG